MRTRLALLALAALVGGCDDDPAKSAPDGEVTGACSMPLRGPGIHSIARYQDGFMSQSSPHVAIRRNDRGLFWHRLDGTARGRIDLSAEPLRDEAITLVGDDLLVVSGWDEGWDYSARVIRLSTGDVVHEADHLEMRGDWVLDDDALISLSTGVRHTTGCSECRFITLDGHQRAWLLDSLARDTVVVDVETGAVDRRPVDPWSVDRLGDGVAVRAQSGDTYYGAGDATLRCEGRLIGAPDGALACLIRDREESTVTTYGPDLQQTGAHTLIDSWQVQGFEGGFLVNNRNGAKLLLSDGEMVRYDDELGSVEAPSVVVLYNADRTAVRILRSGVADRIVEVAEDDNPRVEVAPSGRRAVMTTADERRLYDLDTGDVLDTFDTRGWFRFAGDVLIHDGAPLGETPSPNLANIAFPDPDCPAAVMEECLGDDCILAVVEFAQD